MLLTKKALELIDIPIIYHPLFGRGMYIIRSLRTFFELLSCKVLLSITEQEDVGKAFYTHIIAPRRYEMLFSVKTYAITFHIWKKGEKKKITELGDF